MSAFGGKADMTFCACPLLRSLLGVKRTWPVALHMSAFDPKRTFVQYGSSPFFSSSRLSCREICLNQLLSLISDFLAQGNDHVATGRLGPNTGLAYSRR